MKITLTTPFLYQNPHTGTPSTTTLTCRQLCRLLCPSTAIAAITTTSAGSGHQKSPIINTTTQLLAYNTITQSYDIDGWKHANSIDVIREACCDTTWYYELSGDAANSVVKESPLQQQQQTKVEGPVTTRTLSELYFVDKVITNRTRVYRCCSTSSSTSSASSTSTTGKEGADNTTAAHQEGGHNSDEGWKEIHQLDNLLLAMEAFHDDQQNQLFDVGSNNGEGETTSGGGDIDQMIFDNDDDNDGINNVNGEQIISLKQQQQQQHQQNVADELEAFLSSTDHLAPHANSSTKQRNNGANNDDHDDEEEEYESDGGTRYIRDNQTGQWIHEALMMMQKEQQQRQQHGRRDGGKNVGANNGKHENGSASASTAATAAVQKTDTTKKRKRKNKPKFSAKSARNWIYITGLPHDTNTDELHTYFSKVGIIDIDPESLKPKIKLYRYKQHDGNGDGGGKVGELKGDASICYARPESVELALQILDENLFRDGAILSVQRAKFEQRGDDNTGDNKSSNGSGAGGTQRKQRRVISEAKRRVARLAAIQAVGWDEGENGRIAGGLKGLRIIVLMNMFDPNELTLGNDDDDDDDDDNENDNESTQRLRILEREIHTKCEEIGAVEKITIFSKHPAGVVIVKFVKPNDASDAVKTFNGKVWEGAIGRKVEASFWDGITDYTAGGVEDAEKEMKETEKRLDKFGDWLEEQELPEEFQLRVEE